VLADVLDRDGAECPGPDMEHDGAGLDPARAEAVEECSREVEAGRWRRRRCLARAPGRSGSVRGRRQV